MSDLRPRIAIRYCTQCRWLLRAAWLAQELLSTFGTELGEVALTPGTGGVFEITYNGETIWERKADGGFPDAKTLNVDCATGSIQIAISATSTTAARTKTESETMVKGKVPCPPSRPGDSPSSAARCARGDSADGPARPAGRDPG